MTTVSASDKSALDRALAANLNPRPTGGSRGLVVTIPGVNGRKSTYRTLIDRRGSMTTAGKYYFERLNADPPDRGFDPDQEPKRVSRGRSETIQLRDGSTATVRTWNHLKGTWRLTKLGTESFGNRQNQWVVRIPVRAYLRRASGSYYIKEDWVVDPEGLDRISFPASMSEEDQRAEVKRQVQAWLTSKT